MGLDHVIREAAQFFLISAPCKKLECADADVARGDARQYRSAQSSLAVDRLSRNHRGERARRRNAERVHRFANQVFPQHRPERSAAVARTRKRRWPRALELNVATPSVAIDHLTQKQRAPVAKLGHKAAE